MFKKKFTTAFALALIVILVLTSGVTASAASGSDVETRTINVSSFNHVRVGGNWDVVYVVAPSHSVRVVMPTEWFARYSFNVTRNTLSVDRNLRSRLVRWDAPARPRIYVYAPSLDSMNLSGSANATSRSAIAVGDFTLNVTGNAIADFNFNISNSLSLNATGSPEVTMSGTTRYLSISGAGVNSIHAFNLEARYARSVSIAGIGVVEVNAVETLDVRVGGTARVYYRGNPEISSRTTGSGRLVNAN